MTVLLSYRAIREGPPEPSIAVGAVLLGVLVGAILFQALGRLRLRAAPGARYVDVVAVAAVVLVVAGFWLGWRVVSTGEGAPPLSTLGTLWGIALESVRSHVGAQLRETVVE